MTTAPGRALEAAATVRLFVPKFRVIRKADSAIHRAVARVAGPTYMTRVVTTLGFTAALPADAPNDGTWIDLLHEGRHALQARRWTRPGFAAAYALPQLAAPAVVAAGATIAGAGYRWGWVGMAGLGLLTPLPAPWRARWELEAYRVTVACAWWYAGDPPIGYTDHWAASLAGGVYYRAWPRAAARDHLDRWLEALRNGAPLDAYLRACRDLALRYRSEDGTALARAIVYANR